MREAASALWAAGAGMVAWNLIPESYRITLFFAVIVVAGWLTVRARLAVALGVLLLAVPAGAGPIRESVARLADAAVQEQATVCAPSATDSERLRCLEARLDEVKRVADDSATCIRDSFVFAGTDLMTSAVAWKRCPECGESNPLGFSTESRVALKFSSLGVQIATCYETAKGGAKPARIARWTLRGINLALVVNNLIAAFTGKPLVGGGQPPAAQ
jgi:hypothetical protein